MSRHDAESIGKPSDPHYALRCSLALARGSRVVTDSSRARRRRAERLAKRAAKARAK